MSGNEIARSLRPEDREAVRAAVEQGYFEEPTERTLGETAVALDISREEARRRLARGLATLLRTDPDGGDGDGTAVEFPE